MMHIQIHNFQLKDLHAIYNLSKTLAHFFPKPDQFSCGIYELLLNAVEHGNLGIGFEEKTALIRSGRWHAEISQRLMMQKYADKIIDIKLIHDTQKCRLTIRDSGNGFHWKHFIASEADDHRPNGRGLQIAFASEFDDMHFNEQGNEVTCIAHYASSHVLTPEMSDAA
jgi:hypothetical protein